MGKKKVSFLLDEEELGLLEKVAVLEPYLVDVIDNAKRVKDQYHVKFWVTDIEDTLGALSYAASCMVKYPENEKMLKLHEKIEGYLFLHQALG